MAKKTEGEAEHLKGSGSKPEAAGEAKGGEKGHTLHAIHTRFTKSGAAIHEHHYKDKHGMHVPEKPEYVSSNMDDLHQHMDDHAGPMMAQGEPEGGGDGEEASAAPAAQPAAGGAPAE
jgi:hypothetical protein